MTRPYFTAYETRKPPVFAPMSARQRAIWHFLAGCAVAAGAYYLQWRWSASLNADALGFSVLVVGAETLFFLGTLMFYFDFWDEGDTLARPYDSAAFEAASGASAPQSVDIFITTYDEDVAVVAPSISDAKAVIAPEDMRVQIWLLDDGDRADMAQLAKHHGIGHFARSENLGFKAGNLRNGLLRTSGDFVVICDADTRLLPTFLQNTLGYFSDPQIAWVQTPHWFYDVPPGESWSDWIVRHIGGTPAHRLVRLAAAVLTWLTGRGRIGADPFLADPTVFFDVIQRRRNRNNAAFCCGAASIHRREAVFAGAIKRKSAAVGRLQTRLTQPVATCLRALPLQPYRFHVSEDLYTSILLHEDAAAGWKSVYHPQVEARMLSPMSLTAWAAQRLKYAGGTFDIAAHDNPIFRRGLSWRQKLHYGATFWSYLNVLWAPVLLLAPVVSLTTAVTPVKAYSLDFFMHFLPAVVLGELAMLAACKGYPVGPGRVLGVAALPVHWHAFICVLRGQKPRFAPTPKLPLVGGGLRHVLPHLVLLALMSVAAAVGIVRTALGHTDFSAPLLWVNLFWLGVNMTLIARLVPMAWWTPPAARHTEETQTEPEAAHGACQLAT
ncbi:glycosyltransferase [Shimia sp. R9_1]|uniref:glycosyltransferase family 2 protein n=1 Tax=Shimia sp. R9_1 TaxID=2821111 RepID=UPI001AD964AF|nr:cellulose synthase catalytic subunit [Shimia sp. R9_1]MBO9406218.1 glycosyltransferase [Shimia sp. R9_1]